MASNNLCFRTDKLEVFSAKTVSTNKAVNGRQVTATPCDDPDVIIYQSSKGSNNQHRRIPKGSFKMVKDIILTESFKNLDKLPIAKSFQDL